MVPLKLRGYFNNILLSFLLTVFALTYTVPAQAIVNELTFMYRLEQLVEKLMKLEKKGKSKDMISLGIEIKNEIESTYGIKLSLNDYLDSVEREVKTRTGQKIDKKQMKVIRDKFKKEDKAHRKQTLCLAHSMYDEHEFMHYQASKHQDRDENKEDKEEVYIPAQLVFGVTLSLVGFFLMAIPVPGCKDWGVRMVSSGVVICGNVISGKMDRDHNEQQKEKEKR